MEKIVLTIDGQQIEAESGTSVLSAALAADIYIPHLCHHPDLPDASDCKLCVVEIEGCEGMCTSCNTPARDGMVIRTRTDALRQSRMLSMELMLAGHPSECTSCTKYLKCELQSVIQYLGVSDARVRKLPMPYPVETENPLLVRDMNRCIRCGRCVRACRDLRGCNVLTFSRLGEDTLVAPKNGGTLADSACRFCTACVAVCPTGALMDKESVMQRFEKTDENLVPCRASCPAHTDVPRYVRFIKEGRFGEAVAVIRQRAPFPLTLGHICTAFCEAACRRNDVNGAVAIRELKKFTSLNDTGLWHENSLVKPSTGKRVAVVGGGPAGLTAAYYLVKQGHVVTVFEREEKAGGMLRLGIPEYRLPREVIDGEIEEVLKVGITLKTGTAIQKPAELLSEGYDAVLVAVGTHRGIRLPVEGKDLPGVLLNTTFLREVALHQAPSVGKRVLVLGGGNVAFDCARTARRLGAEEVAVACLESREAMTASLDEITEGTEEGLVIHNSKTFLRIEKTETGLAVICEDVASFHFDEARRLVLNTVPDSLHALNADTIIFSVGQIPDLTPESGLELGRGNRITVVGHATPTPGIFAAGDAMTGTLSVIHGIQSGREVAADMDRYLGGLGDIDEVLAPPQDPSPFLGEEPGYAYQERHHAHCRSMPDRAKDFGNAVEPFDGNTAHSETERCLQCDLRLKLSKVKYWSDYAQH